MEEQQSHELGISSTMKKGGGSTQARASSLSKNPSKLTRTAVTKLASPADIADLNLNHDTQPKDRVIFVPEPQLMGVDFIQKSNQCCTDKETEGSVGDNHVNSTQAHVKMVDVHENFDMALEGEGDTTIHTSNHVSHKLPIPNKQTKWTRIVRPKNYDGTEIVKEQINIVGHKREHADYGLALGPNEKREEKRSRTVVDLPYPNISMVENTMQPR